MFIGRITCISSLIVILILVDGAIGSHAVAQNERVPSAEDLVDTRRASDVQIAPDGDRVAFTVSAFPSDTEPRATRTPAVWVVSTDGEGSPRRLTPAGRTAHSPRWSPDGDAVAFLMTDEKDRTQIFLQSRTGDEPTQLTRMETGVNEFAWSPGAARIAFTASDPSGVNGHEDPIVVGRKDAYTRLWTVPTGGGEVTRVTTQDWDVEAMTWAPDGRRLALIVSGLRKKTGVLVERMKTLVTVHRSGDHLQTLTTRTASPASRRQILDWSPDGQTILFGYKPLGERGHRIGLVPSEGGSVRRILNDYEGTFMRVTWLPDSRHLLAQSFEKVQSHLLRVEVGNAEIEELTDFYATDPSFSVSGDGSRVAYVGESLNTPANVWLFEEGEKDRRLTMLTPHAQELTLGTVREVRWRNETDGITLYGTLVVPPKDRAKPPYATVVQVHGGPHHHSGLGWLPQAQWFASRGYAVLLPNFRGSTGRTWDFTLSIHQRLGDPDGRDVLTGVDALIERGISDSTRLYVGGGSYGGFLTAWLITQTDRFRAAIVEAGISDYYSFAGSSSMGPHWARAFFPGHPHQRPEAYRNHSPSTYLHRVTTPTLILHGEVDSKVPVGQAWQLYRGLQWVGVESKLVIYPREGHGVDERSHHIDRYQRILKWYDNH